MYRAAWEAADECSRRQVERSVGSIVCEQLQGRGRGIFNWRNHAQTSLLVSEVMGGRGGRHVSLTRACCEARLVRPSFLLVEFLGWN
jgi:hypothetical protein